MITGTKGTFNLFPITSWAVAITWVWQPHTTECTQPAPLGLEESHDLWQVHWMQASVATEKIEENRNSPFFIWDITDM